MKRKTAFIPIKAIALLLALVLTLSLAACGSKGNAPSSGDKNTATPVSKGGNDATPPASQGNNDATPPASQGGNDAPSSGSNGGTDQTTAPLIGWMKDGTFSYDYTMSIEGPGLKAEGSGSMATDGDKVATVQEMTMLGQQVRTRIIVRDGRMYRIDDENKWIMEFAVGESTTDGMVTDYTGIVSVGTGTGEINGRTLPYEEYVVGETGIPIRYYLDNGQVYGIVTDFEGYKTVMIILNQSNRVPADVFELPAGYSIRDAFGGLDGYDPNDYLPDGFDINDYMPDGFDINDYLPDGFDINNLPDGL